MGWVSARQVELPRDALCAALRNDEALQPEIMRLRLMVRFGNWVELFRGTMMLDDSALLAWIAEDARLLADLCENQPEIEVPSCSGWTLGDLVAHVGPFLTGWYRFNLEHDPENPNPAAAFSAAPPLPDAYPDRIQYLRDGAASFVDSARSADLDSLVWAFGPAEPARYWVLRAATEVALHTWDAAGARHQDYVLSPERSAQSIDEVIRGIWTRSALMSKLPEAPDEPLAIDATDSENRWVVDTDADRRVVVDPDVMPATTVAAPGMQLVLWLSGRAPTSSLAVTGSTEIIDGWNFMPRMGI